MPTQQQFMFAESAPVLRSHSCREAPGSPQWAQTEQDNLACNNLLACLSNQRNEKQDLVAEL